MPVRRRPTACRARRRIQAREVVGHRLHRASVATARPAVQHDRRPRSARSSRMPDTVASSTSCVRNPARGPGQRSRVDPGLGKPASEVADDVAAAAGESSWPKSPSDAPSVVMAGRARFRIPRELGDRTGVGTGFRPAGQRSNQMRLSARHTPSSDADGPPGGEEATTSRSRPRPGRSRPSAPRRTGRAAPGRRRWPPRPTAREPRRRRSRGPRWRGWLPGRARRGTARVLLVRQDLWHSGCSGRGRVGSGSGSGSTT